MKFWIQSLGFAKVYVLHKIFAKVCIKQEHMRPAAVKNLLLLQIFTNFRENRES
jgi:hypothetical protein